MVQIQLVGDVEGYLTVDDKYAVPINKSLSDIRDLSKRKGGFTKTIIVKGDKATNELLGYYFDVNVIAGTFNQKHKQHVILLEDTVPVMEGNMRLLSINKISQSNATFDQEIEYEVTIADDTSTLFGNIGDKFLTGNEDVQDDIDLSYLDHVYQASNVIASISHDWTDGYKYVWPFTIDDQYNLSEFKPAVYARVYWDAIFAAAGKTYEWSSIDDADIQFSKLLIPYNGDKIEPSAADLAFNSVHADEDTLVSMTVVPPVGDTANIAAQDVVVGDEITDPSSAYDPLTGEYEVPFYLTLAGYKINYQFEIQWRIVLENTEATTAYLRATSENANVTSSQFGGFTYNPYHRYRKNGVDITTSNKGIGSTGVSQSASFGSLVVPSIAAGSTMTLNETFNTTIPIPYSGLSSTLNPGDLLSDMFGMISAQSATSGNLAFWSLTPPPSGSGLPYLTNPAQVNIKFEIVSIDLKIYPTATATGYLTNLRMNQHIPLKIKQKDFVKSILSMFNLYCEVDENDENNIIIMKRDEFYDSGEEKDWTKKVLIDKEATIQFAPELVAKQMYLTYKEGTDDINKGYKSTVDEIYGQYLYVFDDENIKGDSKVELIFEPSPLIRTGALAGSTSVANMFVTSVNGEAPKTGLRIIYDGGARTASANYTIYDIPTLPTVTNQYNYAGHFDDPILPSYDLNFGVCDYYFYQDYNSITNNNLFGLHWRRTLGQINNGKLLTAYFDLRADDITNLKMNDKIFLKDTWWNIQEVIDYNASSRQPTKVKLLSVDDDLDFATFIAKIPLKPGYIDGAHLRPIQQLSDNVSLSRNTFFGSQKNLVLGTGNEVGEDARNNIIIGNDNVVNGSGNLVIGNGLTVNNDGGIISLDTTWERDGEDIRARENTDSSPYIAPNILPALDGNGKLGVSTDMWQELWIGSTNQFVQASNDNVQGKGVPGIILRNEQSLVTSDAARIFIENGDDSSITLDNAGGVGIFGDSNIGIGVADYTEYIDSTGFLFFDENSGESVATIATGSFIFATDSTTALTESFILADPTQIVVQATASITLNSAGTTNISSSTVTFVDGIDGLVLNNSSGTASSVSDSSLSVGQGNVGTGLLSTTIGLNNTASASYSYASGNGAQSTHFGEWSRTNSESSAQYGELTYARRTTNATITEVFLDGNYSAGGSAKFTIATDTTYRVKITALAVDEATGDSKEWEGFGIIKNVAGTTSLVAAIAMTSTVGDVSLATAAVTVTADDTTDYLKIEVTGILATDIRWFVKVEYLKIIF